MRVVRLAWGVLAGVYGAVAAGTLLVTQVLGDAGALTYSASLVAFWWLAPTVLLLVGSLVLRTWRAAALLLVPAVVWSVVFGRLWLPNPDPFADPALRAVTWNTGAPDDLEQVVRVARDWSPDVLLLQEVPRGSERELARVLPDYPHQWVGGIADDALYTSGTVAVVSRHPITDVRPVTDLPAGARGTSVVTLDVDGRAVHALPLHLASPCFNCLFDPKRSDQLEATAEAARLRDAEADRYADLVSELVATGDAVLVGGDLNSAALNEPLRQLTGAGLVDAHARAGTGPGFTRGPGPGVARVDVLLSAVLLPLAAREGSERGSDHNPVVADLAWPPGPAPDDVPAEDGEDGEGGESGGGG